MANEGDQSLAGSLSSLAGQLEAAKEVGAAANQLLLSAGGHPVDVSKFDFKLTCLGMVCQPSCAILC